MTWSRLRRIRQVVQILAFALYVYLLFAALQRRAAFPLADLFFRLDPLAALGASVAARAWIPRLALALITLGLTLAFGRVWCGWLCPLGMLLEWVRFREARSLGRARFLSPRWRAAKHFVLLTTLIATLLGNLTLLVLDPVTLLTRTATTAILPAFNRAVTTIETALYPAPFLRPLVDAAERLLRGPLLPVVQPVFGQNVVLALLFTLILALNLFADRFWCRTLCPLGALLGLLSKLSLLRPAVNPACNRCGECVTICRLEAIDLRRGYEILPSECTVCLDCLAACPQSGFSFRAHLRPVGWERYEPSRRQFLGAAATAVIGVLLMRTGVWANEPHPEVIRPPGAQDEDLFLSRCIRCSQCMKVCPTSGLQPVLTEAGLEGLWTPRLVPRLGYCNYGCNACGQVCPSNAIPRLTLEEKRRQVIGVAVLDRDRCLPWADGTPCIVCEEMCPTPQKTIRLEETTVINAQGEPVVVQRPYVLREQCIGCGICEYQCPVEGEAAIRVYRG